MILFCSVKKQRDCFYMNSDISMYQHLAPGLAERPLVYFFISVSISIFILAPRRRHYGKNCDNGALRARQTAGSLFKGR